MFLIYREVFMEFIDLKLAEYVERHTSPEHEILKKLNRETHAQVMMPRMLSGHLQGSFLTLLSRLIQPEHILEIGTYTGYSAICLASGLKENGRLHTIDINEELETITKKYFHMAGLSDKIIQHFGNALNIIPTLNEPFDMVFIDADKSNYLAYYDLVFPMVRPGGLIIADNVLWSGKVTDEQELTKDADTRALHAFNQRVSRDERVEAVLSPIRDGLMLIRKK